MRILHVVPTYLPAWRHGGPIFAVHGLAKALVARGHEVAVFTTDVHGDGRLDVPLGVPIDRDGVAVRYFPVTAPRRLYRSPALTAALEADVRRYDRVHLHSLFLLPTRAGARAAERAAVPYLVAPRGMLVPELLARRGRLRKRLWIELVERRTLRAAAGLHVTSDLEAAEARAVSIALPRIFVVPNGIAAERWDGDLESLAPAVRRIVEDASPYLLFLGRLSWKKGLDRLLAAFSLVAGTTTLVVAGNDEEKIQAGLEGRAAALGIGGRTVFLGAVGGREKAALLRRAAALVLPSYSENFGNVVLEAWAARTPVVVTPEVGLAATVAEVEGGIVAAGEPEPLSAALRAVLADSEERIEMGRRGAAAAAGRFSWPAVAARMEEVYLEIGAKGRRP